MIFWSIIELAISTVGGYNIVKGMYIVMRRKLKINIEKIINSLNNTEIYNAHIISLNQHTNDLKKIS